jgi:hypothetical protein
MNLTNALRGVAASAGLGSVFLALGYVVNTVSTAVPPVAWFAIGFTVGFAIYFGADFADIKRV